MSVATIRKRAVSTHVSVSDLLVAHAADVKLRAFFVVRFRNKRRICITNFEKAKEYALLYVPEKGFVVEVYHVADSSDALDTASYKVSWASGMDGIKAGEWTYVAFSRRAFEQTVFYVNDAKVSVSLEKSDWDDTKVTFSLEPSDRSDSVGVRAYFEVGGFTGKLDELMVGGCFRDDTWTRLTYLNQKPENYWPVLSKK